MKYWLNLFSGETWQEFLAHGSATTGFRDGQKRMAEKVRPGDRFLCYVTGISRFIAVLEAQSASFWDESTIWKGAVFPVRFKVKPLVMVPFENAIPASELRQSLEAFEGSPGGNNFGYLFQGSLRTWSVHDGDHVLRELQRELTHPTHRPIDPKKLNKPTSYSKLTTAHSDKGEVTVPAAEESDSAGTLQVAVPEASVHTEIQWLLTKLGGEMNLNVWVARNDRNREYKGKRLCELPRVLTELPQQFTDAAQKTIELIDVLWLSKKDAYVAAFEIESTTSIYSGLLRMADLISMQPNITLPLYIVAPDERRSKVVEEINRPTFASLPKPMSSLCRFIAISELRVAAEQNHQIARYLPPEWLWNEVAESCELDAET